MINGNLLIVDDEPDLLFVLEYALKKYADQIIMVHNGAEALKIIASHKIHCILCDMNMPIMNGVELIKIIRKENIEIPFIFYTGHGTRDLMVEAVKYGAFDFLHKPIMEGLERAVERGLRKGSGKDDLISDSDDLVSDFRKLLLNMD